MIDELNNFRQKLRFTNVNFFPNTENTWKNIENKSQCYFQVLNPTHRIFHVLMSPLVPQKH